jgi:dimeric dUTPase (all-alpha-NTP-PPase superfamily)
MLTINPVLLRHMLQLQDETNRLTIGDNWIKKGLNWDRAIFVECAEGVEHLGWKWWKKQLPDYDQAVMEVVDIWHFVMSLLMQEINGEFEDCVNLVIDEIQEPYGEPLPTRQEAFERVAATAIITGSAPIRCFVQLLHSMNISFTHLYKWYVGKAALNRFRQANGYAQGSYVKQWNGQEDNIYLVDILTAIPDECIDADLLAYVDSQLSAVYGSLQPKAEG